VDALSRLLGALQRQAFATLHLTEADRLLDVGCATGAAARHAARLGGSASVSTTARRWSSAQHG